MHRILGLGLTTILGICVQTGCGKSESSGSGATAAGGASANGALDPATSKVAKATADFLDAVLKGDTQRASARLTPQAMQRIIASGKQFAPPGLETASFRIGQIRTPSQDQALVQCVLTDASGGKQHSEEMCCLMRFVDNDWRVSGIAYGTAPNQPWTLSNFETGQNTTIPRQQMGRTASGDMAAGNTGGRPSPRTAQEPAPTTQR
jgi:hypothetical protein